MDVREKLVELLKTAPTRDGYTDLADIAEYLIDHGVTVQEWISVEEDLPKIGQEVFVHAINPDEGYEEDYAMVYDPSLYFPPWKYVTHWMPVPELPKDMRGGGDNG